MTLEPARRPPENENLRRDLEFRFNTGSEGNPKGPYGMFLANDFVRLIRQGGLSSSFSARLVGVGSCSYEKAGYTVKLIYHLSNREGGIDVKISAKSAEGTEPGEGRQWYIAMEETTPAGNPDVTPEGEQASRLRSESRRFAEAWFASLGVGRVEQAYLSTLPSADREGAAKKYNLGQAQTRFLALSGPLNARLPTSLLSSEVLLTDSSWLHAQFLPGYDAFAKGSLVRLSNDFWAKTPEKKTEYLQVVKALFASPSGELPSRMRLAPARMVNHRAEGGKQVFEHDLDIGLRNEHAFLDGHLVVECDEDTYQKGKPPNWRVVSLELTHATVVGPGGGGPGSQRAGPPRGMLNNN
jgi:hypothetical protein